MGRRVLPGGGHIAGTTAANQPQYRAASRRHPGRYCHHHVYLQDYEEETRHQQQQQQSAKK